MGKIDQYTKNIIIFSGKYQNEKEYWLARLNPYTSISILPYDTGISLNLLGMFTYITKFSETVSNEIIKLCKDSNNGIFVVVMTGICYILQKYTGENHILLGCPALLNQEDNNINDFVPFTYANAINMTFKETVMELKKVMVEAYKNQNYPMSDIFEILNLPLAESEPYYSITAQMQEIHKSPKSYSDSDLAFILSKDQSTLKLKIKYNAQLYHEETIKELVTDLMRYFECIHCNYNQSLDSLDVVSEESIQSWKEKQASMVELRKQQDNEEIHEENFEYAHPKTDREKELVSLWTDILGKEKIGIDDNFFLLGGDSLKAVKLVASLYKYGIKVKDVYNQPTIRQLAQLLLEEKKTISQETVEGDVNLSPIQLRFFHNYGFQVTYYNQAMMLYREDNFDQKYVNDVMKAIVSHHDMLRAKYYLRENQVIQTIQTIGYPEEFYSIQYIDVTEEVDERVAIETIAKKEQASLDFHDGTLIRIVCFHTSHGDHLLFIVHHLLSDAYSLRIILECFAVGYKQKLLGKEIKLPDKTDSYKVWVDKLIQIAQDSVMRDELAYWSKVASNIRRKTEKEAVSQTELQENRTYINFVYSENETKRILQSMIEWNLNIDEFLLAGTILSLKKSYRDKLYVVDLENHGRGDIDDEINISRTVGWFTNIYSIGVEIQGDNVISGARQLRLVLEKVPSQGLGYSLLKYYGNPEVKEQVDLKRNPEILFNYLGGFDNDIDSEVFKLSDINPGSNVDATIPNSYLLDIAGVIVDNKLRINVSYMNAAFTTKQIEDYQRLFNEMVLGILTEENTTSKEILEKEVFHEGYEPFNDLIYKDCFYNALFPIVKHYHKSIDVFLGNDAIIYTNDGSVQNIDIDYKETTNIIDLINMYGIKTRQIVYSPDILQRMKEALVLQHPVIIRVDCYYLKERKDTYLTRHWPHTLLVLGYDDEKKIVNVFDQSDINALDFTDKQITYDEVYDAYEGLNANFIVDEKSPSFIEFEQEESISVLSEKKAKELFVENYMQYRSLKEEGFLVLEIFIHEFQTISKDQQWFLSHADGLAVSFRNILNSKYVEEFRFKRLFAEEIEISRIQKLISLWRLCLNILEKYAYRKRYKAESVETILNSLQEILSLEKELHQQILSITTEKSEGGTL